MATPFMQAAGFSYLADIRRVDLVSDTYCLEITSTWAQAKDPLAKRALLRLTLNQAGLATLRDLCSSHLWLTHRSD